MSAIDIVIPAHEKDFPVLTHAVRGALRHISPLRRIHVVSATPFSYPSNRVVWVDEPKLPLLPTLPDVRELWGEDRRMIERASWIYQQLLKLGAGRYIPDLAPQYLVVDADVIFLRKVSFDPDALGRFPYARAYEYHMPYREAFERLNGAGLTQNWFSLTSHHMLYDRELMEEMFADFETRFGVPWYQAYIDAVDREEHSSISEMDIYGWWVLDRHPELGQHRQLYWRDVRVVPHTIGRAMFRADYDFVAAHAYARQPRWIRSGLGAVRLGAETWASLTSRWTSS
jgi:hypothetical protein